MEPALAGPHDNEYTATNRAARGKSKLQVDAQLIPYAVSHGAKALHITEF
jgi:hypothetical protein